MLVIDLHCHTTASDGTLDPSELIPRARADGADVIAVTDHDTVDGIEASIRSGNEMGVRVIPGIELSCYEHRSVHMLGYFIDPTSAPLLTELGKLKAERVTRAQRIVERLRDLGYELTFDEVRAQSAGEIFARPHIARAMVARGYIDSVRDAFTSELIGDGGLADVTKRSPTPVEGIELIRAAGGVPVIAHSAVGHHEGPERSVPIALIEELKEAGLVGIEADHPDHPRAIRDELTALAAKLDLVPTGGSDFHGESGHRIGNCTTSADALEALESASGAT
ncbi:MAG: PHP domain-containing protein [Actinomycetota bacterium]